MAGAYTSLPAAVPVYVAPPLWNIEWPFLIEPEFALPAGSDDSKTVAPNPPGYENDYSVVGSME